MAAITRRSLLSTFVLAGAAAVGAGAGLLRPVHHKVAVPPEPPPDLLVIALDDARRLDAAYAAAVSRDPGDAALLQSLRSDVIEHQHALRALLENYPGWRYQQSLPTAGPTQSASPYPSPSAGAPIAASGDAVRAALKQIGDRAASASVHWPVAEPHAAEAVGLFGSIAATLSTHIQVLS